MCCNDGPHTTAQSRILVTLVAMVIALQVSCGQFCPYVLFIFCRILTHLRPYDRPDQPTHTNQLSRAANIRSAATALLFDSIKGTVSF